MRAVIGRRLFVRVGAMVSCAVLASDRVPATEPAKYLRQFRAMDAAAGDEFGRAVALDGRLGIIGAPSRDESGTDSGAAYLFDVATGQQLMKLLPEDGQAGDAFGVSVAVQGNLAVVGSIYVTEEELSTGNIFFETPVVQRVMGLEEPFVRLVPAHLQESGVLVMASEGRLQQGNVIEGFPLQRLAASIRSTVRIDDWEEGDLPSLLTRDKAGTRRLTQDQRHTIARWLVHRLLDDLPQE